MAQTLVERVQNWMIKQYDISQSYEFTAHQVHEGVNRMNHSGYNVKQVRTAIRQLVEAKKVEKVGETTPKAREGRPQHIYSAVSILRRIEAETAPTTTVPTSAATTAPENEATSETEPLAKIPGQNQPVGVQSNSGSHHSRTNGNDVRHADSSSTRTVKASSNVSKSKPTGIFGQAEPMADFKTIEANLAKATSSLHFLNENMKEANKSFIDQADRTEAFHKDVISLQKTTAKLINGLQDVASRETEIWRDGYRQGFKDGMEGI